jgi:hypothetical protein
MQMQVITNKIGGGRFMENLEWVKFNDLEKKKSKKGSFNLHENPNYSNLVLLLNCSLFPNMSNKS